MNEKDGKLLYHLTALDNLASIVEHGLLSRRDCTEKGITFTDVADQDILENRETHGLDEMVPFHFFAKNPFDYAVKHGNPGKRFILITVSRSYARESDWRIVPVHPLSGCGRPEQLAWDNGIAQIDWDLIEQRNYSDRDCKQACMAEALSPRPVLLSVCQSIIVADERDQKKVEKLAGHLVRYVNINSKMLP